MLKKFGSYAFKAYMVYSITADFIVIGGIIYLIFRSAP
tara:strand:+ start:444 stop:557 length:114 start_codon:yes stop_codon:yes gene_type:complete